ncbi:MAG: hypothetical protein H6621_06105 [Halobacteriovoraceae bacterium]|nr:hypothetical protein [Halobacteriovoraceae bacterium]
MSSELESYRNFIKRSRENLRKILKNFSPDPSIKFSLDLVTKYDLEISSAIKSIVKKLFGGEYFFFSEEERSHGLKLPLCLVDPIDGTFGFATGSRECALSLSFIHDYDLQSEKNVHWIWNFLKDEESFSIKGQLKNFEVSLLDGTKTSLRGLVSRRDSERGLFQQLISKDYHLEQMGSIAYKLLKLSLHQCDFVYSVTDKNIWDIFAGSALATQAGYFLYNKQGLVTRLESELIKGPLLWCRESDYNFLRKEIIEK